MRGMTVRSALLVVLGTMASSIAPDGAGAQASGREDRAPRFLLASSESASHAVALDVSRTPVLRQRITLDLSDVTLKDALATIARRAGLRLAYAEGVVPLQDRVSLHAKEMTVTAALTDVLIDASVDVVLMPGGRAILRARDGAARLEAGTIVGRVATAKTNEWLAGVEVYLSGTRWKTTTDTGGRYRLDEVENGTYNLVARRLGYVMQSRKVTVRPDQADTADFALEVMAVPLDELVTTATGRQRRRDIGNAITTIKADSVLRTAPIRNLTDLLDGRVPGLSVQHTSGAPGDPARLRLRGLGSVMRSNDPVVVVDGVRVYSAQSAARSGNLTNALRNTDVERLDPAPSPLDQIDPNIIETIEVFKGPSAATLYGADAANGVIVITTKRGKPGPTRWDASVVHSREVAPGRWPAGYYNFGHINRAGLSFCAITNFKCVPDSLVRFQALNERDLTVLGRGQRTAVTLTASGGSQALTYSVTGSYDNAVGLLRLPDFEVERFRTRFNREAPDWMRRPHHLTVWNVASNVTARLGATADVNLAARLGRTQQERSSLENQLGRLAATYVDRVTGAHYDGTIGQFLAPNSSYLTDFYTRTTAAALDFTTSLRAEWRPRPWLTANAVAGLNVIPRDDQQLLPAGLASPTDSGAFTRATGQSLVSTFDAQARVRRPLRWGFFFEATAGANLKTESTADLAAAAAGLVPGTSTLTGANRVRAYESRASSSVFGWAIEPTIRGERLSLSTGLRLDGGNTYGTRLRGLGNLLALPKLNGSWVISEERWFPFTSLFSSLRLRGAYGQAQVQPGPADRLRLYRYTAADAGGVKLTTLGNTQLRPERSNEVEGGFDADLLESRVSVEFTLYRKTRVDALMSLTVPPSVNGGTDVPFELNGGGAVLTNIGTIRNTGVELTLGVTPLRLPAVTWSNQLMYNRNDNRLVELGRGVVPNPQQGLVAGYPVGGRWAQTIVGYADQNGDGVLEASEVRVSDSVAFLGRIAPLHEASLFSNLSLFGGAIGVSAGFTYETGATQLNEVRSPVLWRALVDPSAPLSEQAALVAPTTYGRTEDVSTFRFQTFSVNYQAPRRVAKLIGADRLGVALQGSNLAIHSTYRGKDPDVNAWAPGEGVQDTGQLPMPRTWQLRFNLAY